MGKRDKLKIKRGPARTTKPTPIRLFRHKYTDF
uniref:Uncharacterized protein n=1 Tax=Siphoviridae sp. ctr8v12 TaxID=2825685 RepID=A0A8S5QFF6_9CAUD|nr:MAG TPA: hypothetical protein [Siphoviridae sp. ctr8v12]